MDSEVLCTWDKIKAECDVLDQMASQTVLKACDIGDMLRALRLTMEPKSFAERVRENLSRSEDWAGQLIILSFRREAVLKALSEGEANDSIRSAYEHVKALPAPETEQQERQQWPRAKRGPEKGSGGRPPVQPIEHFETAVATAKEQAGQVTTAPMPRVADELRKNAAMREELDKAERTGRARDARDPNVQALAVWVPIESAFETTLKAIARAQARATIPTCPSDKAQKLIEQWATISEFLSQHARQS
jgi:hypothetical protein